MMMIVTITIKIVAADTRLQEDIEEGDDAVLRREDEDPQTMIIIV